jgi:hypothetical protein
VGGNHGTLKGGVTFAPGVAGQAFRLDGVPRYVEVPRSDLWGFGLRDFSIELWVQFRALTPARFIGCDEGPGSRNKWFFEYHDGILGFHINGAGWRHLFDARADFSPDPDRWYHLAVTRSRGTFTIYVNGAPVASEKFDILIPHPDAPLTIGQAEDGCFFSGLLDEVAIYDHALSPAEVKARWSALASATKPVAEEDGQVTPDKSTSKYLILPIDKVASAVSTKSLFTGRPHERLIFPTWGKQDVLGIPFNVIDPKGDSVKNAIVLYGPEASPAREMPKAVRLKCESPAKAIHLLSGVAGWGYDVRSGDPTKTVSMIVRLHYRDGRTEDHELINGVHFCEFHAYARRLDDVPGSRLAMRLLDPVPNDLTQIRYLAIQPKNPSKVIEEIEFTKGMKGDISAPVIMAVTVEKPAPAEETP